MARYTGPANKQARRVGFSILENGKDLKRPYGPGQHGKDRKRKPSNYAVQLNEKQKVRFMYGISEKQFKKLVNDAAKMKGVHGENLLILLESRLRKVFLDIKYHWLYNINEFGSNTDLFLMCYVLVTYSLHKGKSIKTPYK